MIKRLAYIALLTAGTFFELNALEVREIPVGQGYAATSVNTAVFRGSSLVSDSLYQYISYYDSEGNIIVGKRSIDETDWLLNTTQYKGNVADAHNVISLGIDGDGYLHMSFDHHGHPLHYTRSIAPGSLEFGPMTPMIGDDEQDVTYPDFYTLPNGDLLFAYRSGASGRGNLVLNRYSVSNRKWTRVHDILIDGEGARNAYWQICTDNQGTIHLSWVWRETWLVETNHDLCYAKSTDGGQTWTKSDGTPYELPIKASTAEIAVEIPENSELINQTSMSADALGNPYIATYWRDWGCTVPQYRIVWHDAEGWHARTVGYRTEPFSLSGGGTKMIPIARPIVVCGVDGPMVVMRDAERGSKVSVATQKNDRWTITDITEYSVNAWEPTFDRTRWNRSAELDVFVQPTHQGDGERVVSGAEPSIVSVIEVRQSAKNEP